MGKSLEVSKRRKWTLTKSRRNSVHFSRKASSTSSKFSAEELDVSFVSRCRTKRIGPRQLERRKGKDERKGLEGMRKKNEEREGEKGREGGKGRRKGKEEREG